MKIALDYDGTYTADPAAWLAFAVTMTMRGHDVRIVTMRYPSEKIGMDTRLLDAFSDDAKFIFTSRKAKRAVCGELGFDVDVWVDDNPQAVDHDAAVLWGDKVFPEGTTDTGTHVPGAVPSSVLKPADHSATYLAGGSEYKYPALGHALPPGGADVHLININDGVVVRGVWDARRFDGWAPLPKRNREHETRLRANTGRGRG